MVKSSAEAMIFSQNMRSKPHKPQGRGQFPALFHNKDQENVHLDRLSGHLSHNLGLGYRPEAPPFPNLKRIKKMSKTVSKPRPTRAQLEALWRLYRYGEV